MRTTAAAAVALAVVAATPAPAQAPAQAPAAAEAGASWFKICNRDQQAKKDVCLISHELRTDSGQSLASVAIRETPGEQRKVLLASIPVGMTIKPGVMLQIDGGDATKMDFTICFQAACYAELPTDNKFITRLKGGRAMTLTAYNGQGKPVSFDMPLAGFTSAYDGAGMAPAERQKQLEEQQRRQVDAEQQMRDRLIAEQRRAVEEAAGQ